MLQVCSDQELSSLSNSILKCKPKKELNRDQKPLLLAIRRLKRFIQVDSKKLIQWIYSLLKERKASNNMSDIVNLALVDLMKDNISFHNAIDDTSNIDTLFNLVKRESLHMIWLLNLIGERLPHIIIPKMHQYLINGFTTYGNPFLGSFAATPISADQQNIIYIGDQLFQHMLQKSDLKSIAIESTVHLLERYLDWINHNTSFITNEQKYTLSYLLCLPKISPLLTEAAWPLLFTHLYQNDAAGSMFLYEKLNTQSFISPTETVTSLFSTWLTTVAFDSKGIIMKHAMDVAILLDTLAHDPRLDLTNLIPTGDSSIIDTLLRPSFDQLDLHPTSIGLIDWTLYVLSNTSRTFKDLQIPLFLLQLILLKSSRQDSINTFVQLITRLNSSNSSLPHEDSQQQSVRYLVLNLIEAVEPKWPGIFESVLESIFSRTIAMHIADSEGSINVEKILGNLAMLFEEPVGGTTTRAIPGFIAFQNYSTLHWRQILLLFLNHPSMECRVVGYKVLINSRFWEKSVTVDGSHTVEGCDPQSISKLLIEAWFRQIKTRYLRFGQPEETAVINEQQRLIAYCCQHVELAKSMLSYTMDLVLGGHVEVFPSVDINVLQQEKLSLFDKVRQEEEYDIAVDACIEEKKIKKAPRQASHVKKPPQFMTCADFLKSGGENQFLDVRDEIYTDNIKRTAALFYQFTELPNYDPNKNQYQEVSSHVLSRLALIWLPNTVALDTYDDVLPKNIPYQCDIAIGSAFKDHPVLFLIFEKYLSSTTSPSPTTQDMTRSILVYFIAFWNMREVISVSSTLHFATQLEETTRLIHLLSPMLPPFLVHSHKLFPFLSAKDLGDVLFKTIWYYIRWHQQHSSVSRLPGITVTVPIEEDEKLLEKCQKTLWTVCVHRLDALKHVVSWRNALKNAVDDLFGKNYKGGERLTS